MKILGLISFIISLSAFAQKEGLSGFEKARMIPDSLNSVMLMCESDCSQKNEFESKEYQMCYRGCLDSRVQIKSPQPQKDGLSDFEKAKMIPANLNSMMLLCESDCSKKNTFESKGYQSCYHDCLGDKVESSSELSGCSKDTKIISCPDGVFKKTSSVVDSLRSTGKDLKDKKEKNILNQSNRASQQ